MKNILHTIVAKPFVYDAVQRFAGMETILASLRPQLQQTDGASVLDIGAGTGLYLPAFPSTARYVWLDMDTDKLAGFQKRTGSTWPAMLGDGTQLPVADKSFDYATCFLVAHHLDDLQLRSFVSELARVVRKKVILLDPVAGETWQSRMLWKYDRGSYPRTINELTTLFAQYFDIEHTESYAVYHRYLMLVGQTR